MSTSRRSTWMALLAVTIVTLAMVLTPVFLIKPFSPQTNSTVALSFALRRWSPLLTLVAVAAAVFLTMRLWSPGRRILSRTAAVILLALVAVSAWASRQDYFEWMFAPLPGPGFVRASAAGFVAPGDMVLAVALNGDPVAYPIRQLAYHHLVQDSAGGVPIVATY
jgi:hypothetical protein